MSQNDKDKKPDCQPTEKPKVDKDKLDQSIKDKKKSLATNETVKK